MDLNVFESASMLLNRLQRDYANSLSNTIRLKSLDLKHLIPGNRPPELPGLHIANVQLLVKCYDKKMV